jgi:hypothetical protein
MSRIRTGPGRAGHARRAPAPGALTLSDDFRAWVIDNALRGVERDALLATLVEGGVPARIARAEVDALLGSAAFAACRRMQRRTDRLELVARLLRTMAALAPRALEVERRRTVGAEEFFERYLAASRPVVLTGIMEGWEALARWSPAHFKERLGGVEVEVMTGRDTDPECDRNFEAHRATMRMGDYVDLLTAAGSTNDVYLVAHNKALGRAELRGLLEDIRPPEELFDPARIDGGVSLWFGPAGTVTPLHHDTTSILFCQVVGRKRVALVAPFETALLEGARGFYAGARAGEIARGERPELAEVTVREVELSAGEALFIPAGWWHEVTALEISINLSVLHFRRPNGFGWYCPGNV